MNISLKVKAIFNCFKDKHKEKKTSFFGQLLLFLGKLHVHKKKWSKSKASFIHFLTELELQNCSWA